MQPLSRRLVAVLALAMIVFSGHAHADWRKNLGIFRVGMIEANAPPEAGRDALKRAFEKALGMPVDILVLRDWSQLIDAQASARVNYAVYSSLAYATASQLCNCVEPVAAPVDMDGADGVRAVLAVRRGKAARIADASQLRIASGPVDDLTGWLTPRALLPAAGLALTDKSAFIERTASATEALALMRNGDVDGILTWERAVGAQSEALPGGGLGALEGVALDVLWRSPLIRFGPHAVSKSLDGEAKRLLLAFLIELHGENPQAYDLLSQGHGGGFYAASQADYGVLRDIVRVAAPGSVR